MPEELTAQLREHSAEPPAEAGLVKRTLDCRSTFRRIAEGAIRVIRRDCELAIAGDPNAVHQMRIALTRLNAAALFFSPMIDDVAWSRIRAQLRWLNSALGKTRDHDVTMKYVTRKRYRGWAANSRRALSRSHAKAHRRLAKKLGSARYHRLITELNQWIEKQPSWQSRQLSSSDRTDVYSEAQLRTWRDQICRQGRHLRSLRRKSQHRLRIQCKHFRYVVDDLRELEIPISSQDLSFYKTAMQAHRALGDIRDLRRLRKAVHRRLPGYRKQEGKLLRKIEDTFARAASGPGSP